MKKRIFLLWALPLALLACNNESKDSVEKADSANEAKLDSPAARPALATDAESAAFLVEAADGGMAEVELGQLARDKSMNQHVKDYGAMMVSDHSGANDKVKALAAQRNVTLPTAPGEENQKLKTDLSNKSGKDFDKAYIDAMVNDHEKDIKLFKNASDKVNDAEVKTFIDNTLPVLQHHLDSAKAVRKMLK